MTYLLGIYLSTMSTFVLGMCDVLGICDEHKFSECVMRIRAE